MDPKIKEKYDQIYHAIHEKSMEANEIWMEHVVFTPKWWLVLAITVIPWIAWIVMRKKESTSRFLYATLIVSLLASQLDLLGVAFGLWSYYENLALPVPPFFPWDLSLLPITVMLFLQYKPKIKPMYKGILFALLTSFVGEPIVYWLGLYNPIHWEYYYSAPIYFLIYMLVDYAVSRQSFSPPRD